MRWNSRRIQVSFKKLMLALTISLLSTPTQSVADQGDVRVQRKVLPDLGLNIVCLEDPFEDGWMIYEPSKTNADDQYTLLVRSDIAPPPNENIGEPYSYRLIVSGFPCFYEYVSYAWGGIGTFAENSGNLSKLLVAGEFYPFIANSEHLEKVILILSEKCNSIVPGDKTYPFSIWQDCNTQISDILIANTTILTIGYPDDIGEIKFFEVMFVLGVPYFDGKEVSLW